MRLDADLVVWLVGVSSSSVDDLRVTAEVLHHDTLAGLENSGRKMVVSTPLKEL